MDNYLFREDLPIWTSWISRGNLEYFTNRNILPVFIARTIKNSNLIGGWQDTQVHKPELAPSPKLLRDWKYNGLDDEEFKDIFWDELTEKVSPIRVLHSLDLLSHLSCSVGVVLLGFGEDPKKDHRSIVAEFLGKYLGHEILEYDRRPSGELPSVQ